LNFCAFFNYGTIFKIKTEHQIIWDDIDILTRVDLFSYVHYWFYNGLGNMKVIIVVQYLKREIMLMLFHEEKECLNKLVLLVYIVKQKWFCVDFIPPTFYILFKKYIS
jgi:hypothetical protein